MQQPLPTFRIIFPVVWTVFHRGIKKFSLLSSFLILLKKGFLQFTAKQPLSNHYSSISHYEQSFTRLGYSCLDI